MPTSPSPAADHLIGWLRDYAASRIDSQLIDERRCIPPYIVLDLGNRGALGLRAPVDAGGLDLPTADCLRFMEQLAAIDLTLALFVGNHNALGLGPILKFGSAELREKWVPKLATGRELAAFGLTEPGAGSTPKALETVGTPDGEGRWRITGKKLWIGSASWAGAINVFARVLGADGVSSSFAAFCIGQGTEGLTQGPEFLTLGMRGMVQNAVLLDNVPVTAQSRLGGAGEGLSVLQDTLGFGRHGLGAVCIGGMKRCAQLALRFAERRTISTGRLLHNPVTRHRLFELTCSIRALEALVGVAKSEEEYLVCKATGSEWLWRACDELVQLLGGRGAMETNVASRMLRDARLIRIFEGPTEALLQHLGSRVCHQPVETLSALTGTPDIASELSASKAELLARAKEGDTPTGGGMDGLRWAHAVMGTLAAEAIVLAAVRAHAVPEVVLRWTEQRWQNALATARARRLPIAAANAIALEIAGYADFIGDITPRLAGVDVDLDPLLRV